MAGIREESSKQAGAVCASSDVTVPLSHPYLAESGTVPYSPRWTANPSRPVPSTSSFASLTAPTSCDEKATSSHWPPIRIAGLRGDQRLLFCTSDTLTPCLG